MKQIILASASPRRCELLRPIFPQLEVVASAASEAQFEHLTPAELAQLNAWRKASIVALQQPGALLIGADTIVSIENRRLGKPKDHPEAISMLQLLSGRTHHVITGVCLLDLEQSKSRLFAEITRVTFRNLDLAQIEAYLREINPYDKAGAYAIQEKGDLIVENIEGSWSNVVGLPVERLESELKHW
jgi:septum formation protein